MTGREEIVRAMRSSDLSGALRLSRQAGWNQTPSDWQRLLAWEPDGCFVLDLDSQIAGTVTTTRYGSRLAWIGMLLVDAALRRQGFGRRLLVHALGWLREGGVGTVMLDATPLGQLLYEGLGFRQQYALDRWQGIATGTPELLRQVQPLGSTGLAAAILDLDQRAFGLDRSRLLNGLLAAPDALSYWIGDAQRAGGFVLLRPGARRWHIGPLVAEDVTDAECLLHAALTALDGQPVELDVPRHLPAQDLVRRVGLTPVRPFIRMLWGGPAPAVELPLLYATAAPEIG